MRSLMQSREAEGTALLLATKRSFYKVSVCACICLLSAPCAGMTVTVNCPPPVLLDPPVLALFLSNLRVGVRSSLSSILRSAPHYNSIRWCRSIFIVRWQSLSMAVVVHPSFSHVAVSLSSTVSHPFVTIFMVNFPFVARCVGSGTVACVHSIFHPLSTVHCPSPIAQLPRPSISILDSPSNANETINDPAARRCLLLVFVSMRYSPSHVSTHPRIVCRDDGLFDHFYSAPGVPHYISITSLSDLCTRVLRVADVSVVCALKTFLSNHFYRSFIPQSAVRSPQYRSLTP